MSIRRVAILAAAVAAGLVRCECADAQQRRDPSRIRTRPIQATPSSDTGEVRRTAGEAPAQRDLSDAAASPGAATVRTSRGADGLPNEHGQVWREYDISAFTGRAGDLPHPEQAIIDWVLRETGYEVWHSEPLGILSATPSVLRVYHTPEMQATVAEIVERFVQPAAADCNCGIRLVSVSNPNWRSRAPAKLSPVAVQSAGLQAWLLPKEDASILLASLQQRGDFHEYGSPTLQIPNGQPTVVSALRTRSYTQHLLPGLPGISTYEPQRAEMEEGIAVELTPLVARDGTTLDALIKCNIDQVERITPVAIEAGVGLLTTQRTMIEVPQRSQIRVKETFRWSADEVLLVSLGMVPSPVPAAENLLTKALPLPGEPNRAEVLIFVECRARTPAPRSASGAPARGKGRHGRY